MSALQLAKQAYSAFNREKPHSSITEWVEILTSSNYEDEAYDGIPELVDAINIQATGPAEASRAIRKKIKHGNPHQQYRALVVLKATVENGGHNFQTSFADHQLTDALKNLAADPATDHKVKKKLASVLAAWHLQFKDDPSMTLVANLYKQCKVAQTNRVSMDRRAVDNVNSGLGIDAEYLERKRKEEEARKKREEEKRKAKEEKERRKREEEERRRKPKTKRKPFNFEEEKPQILTSIANASQAASNLVNAMTLVNTEQEKLETNERVQECLNKVKQVRKQIVRYIQLVENEDMIGVLIETNDRIIAALENYDLLTKPDTTEQQVKEIQEGLAATKLSNSELGKLQERQRAVIERSIGRAGSYSARPDPGEESPTSPTSPTSPSYVHPDLQDLEFGALGSAQSNLPPPIRPTAPRSQSDDDAAAWRRGSLSDFSDYQSSDEEAHSRAAGPSSLQPRRRGYVDVSDNESVDVRRNPKQGLLEEEDPFADPE